MLAAGDAGLPKILLTVIIVAIALAFVIGFIKGFRKVSWDGLAWLIAGVVLCLGGKLVKMGDDVMGNFIMSLALSIAVVGVVLVLYGLCTKYLRPRIQWVKDEIDPDLSLAEYGLEYEPEHVEYDGENEVFPHGKRIYKTGYGAPSIFARFMGGVACAINIGLVLSPQAKGMLP